MPNSLHYNNIQICLRLRRFYEYSLNYHKNVVGLKAVNTHRQ